MEPRGSGTVPHCERAGGHARPYRPAMLAACSARIGTAHTVFATPHTRRRTVKRRVCEARRGRMKPVNRKTDGRNRTWLKTANCVARTATPKSTPNLDEWMMQDGETRRFRCDECDWNFTVTARIEYEVGPYLPMNVPKWTRGDACTNCSTRIAGMASANAGKSTGVSGCSRGRP